MKLDRKETSVDDRQMMVLCAMASNVRFATEVGYQISQEVWEDSWARILASWICEYVRHYDSAPLRLLPAMAVERMDSIPDEDTADAVVLFSRRLVIYHREHSEMLEEMGFVTDSALHWIKTRNLEVLRTKLEDALEAGNVKRAEEALHAYAEVKRLESTTVDMMRDSQRIVRAFLEDSGELFTYPGDLGLYTGPFQRGDLFLIMGESGTGKSWMCLQVAYEALRRGLSVLYINLEISENQMIRRIYRSMVGTTVESSDVMVPYFRVSDESDDDGDGDASCDAKWVVASRRKSFRGLSLDRHSIDRFLANMRMGTNGGSFHLRSYPPSSMTVRDIEREMDNMRDYENFVPDMLVVDYGDLLRAENAREEKRTRVDEIYLGLRRIALSRNILVISPTQANREGYGKDLKKQNMSENIGNVNHTSILWGLSHSPKEKEMGITKVRVLKNRDGKEFSDPVVCLGCLDVGRIVLDSRAKRKVVNMEG